MEEIFNTVRGLGESIDETIVVQKILRSLPTRFNPKVSSIEEKDSLDDLKLSQLHGNLITYEMRIDEPKHKEATKKNNRKTKNK